MKSLIIKLFVFFSVFVLVNSGTSWAQNNPSGSAVSDKIFENTLVRMTWEEVKEAADKKAIVLIPISIVEEHGPHMDLSADIMLGSIVCSKIKESLEKDGIKTVIAPPYYWGISLTTNFLPGTFNIKESTMKLLLSEIVENMTSWGFEKFYFIGAHGDPTHNAAISRIAESLNSIGAAKVYDAAKLPDPENSKVHFPDYPGMFSPDYHAGAHETKIVWNYEPSIVRIEKVSSLKPQDTFAPLGYAGDPANFMNSTADRFIDIWAESFVQKIKNHLSTTVKKKIYLQD